MWTKHWRIFWLGLLLVIVLGGLVLAWLRLSHPLFTVVGTAALVLAGLLMVARDGFQQTTRQGLLSRGIDPDDDNYSPVSDSGPRRDWAPLLSSNASKRLVDRQLKNQGKSPVALSLPPVGAKGAALQGTAHTGPAPKGTGLKSSAFNGAGSGAKPAATGRRRQRPAPVLPSNATVNFTAFRREANLDELLAGLDEQLIGLAPVKERVAEIGSLLLVDQARRRFGLTAPRPNLHMCFTGPPGTGKTTVALMMADLLHRLGYLESGHLVHAMRDDLVGQYIGQTAPLTKHVLGRAMGGVLFIDEAYALFRDDDSRDYGQEAIDILMQVMENERDKVVVILAGYKDKMERFFEVNQGMRSRVAHHLDFAPYEADELLAIGQLMLDKSSYYLSAPAQSVFLGYLEEQRSKPHFAHARTVRNALESARLRHAHRLTAEPDRAWSKDDLMRLDAEDVLPGEISHR